MRFIKGTFYSKSGESDRREMTQILSKSKCGSDAAQRRHKRSGGSQSEQQMQWRQVFKIGNQQ